MQYGTPNVRRCPKCRQLALQRVLLRGTAIGVVFYSDSMADAPDHPLMPIFSKCPICGEYCWVDELEKVYVDPNTIADPKYFEMLTIEEIVDFIERGYAKTEQQEYKARFALWWNYNHRIRRKVGAAPEAEFDAALWKDEADKAKWNANLDRLFELAKKLTPEEIPLFAEIRREQGRFDEATAILDGGCEPFYQDACDKIRLVCEAKNRYVFIC